jgi:Fic family protein
MSVYIYDRQDWPRFHWSHERLAERLADVRFRQGRLIGRMEAMGFSLRAEAVLQSLTVEVLKSSEIEGEILDREQVRSSIARRLGMDIGALASTSREIEGVVEMMLDATQNYDKPLTRERLFGWHASLFPTGYSGMNKIKIGAWRDDAKGPMQVVSGPIGREHVHFEAPAAHRLEKEMTAFIEWFNEDDGTDMVLRACIAHLWFVTVHPFEDGNGRIARAIADMTLARSEQTAQRFYSMSAQLRQQREAYYAGLEATQKGTLDITERLEWFLDCLNSTFDGVEEALSAVFRKARFWQACAATPLNERQKTIINKILDGFEGKLTSSKWAKLAKCSQDTALRDIQDLVERGLLAKSPRGGRSTGYTLIEGADPCNRS